MELEILFKLFWKKLSYRIEEACGGNVNQLRSYINSPSSCISSNSLLQITPRLKTATAQKTCSILILMKEKDI